MHRNKAMKSTSPSLRAPRHTILFPESYLHASLADESTDSLNPASINQKAHIFSKAFCLPPSRLLTLTHTHTHTHAHPHTLHKVLKQLAGIYTYIHTYELCTLLTPVGRREEKTQIYHSQSVCQCVCRCCLSVCVCWHIVLRSSDRQTDRCIHASTAGPDPGIQVIVNLYLTTKHAFDLNRNSLLVKQVCQRRRTLFFFSFFLHVLCKDIGIVLGKKTMCIPATHTAFIRPCVAGGAALFHANT